MIYFVSTPIGNLEDITFRAVRILKEVDIIACEDTRDSKKLLNHYKISKKLMSFHKFNELSSCEKIIELNSQGQNIAIISDAGMPVISDPGNSLTKILRERNISFTIIPGANAALSALVLSGLDASTFFFCGFLPENKKEKTATLKDISIIKSTLIFYISPHNLKKDIAETYSVLGERRCALVKEITKIYETVYSFSLGDKICLHDDEDKEGCLVVDSKGEFVLIVEGATKEDHFSLSVIEHVKFYINLGFSKNDAIKKVAHERNVKKDVIYKEVLKS